MVNIIDISLRVDELNQVLDDGDNILAGKNTVVDWSSKTKLLVDTIATYLTEVIALVAEEEVLNYFACRSIIGRLSVTKLTIDVDDSLLLGVGGVLLQRIVDDGIIIKLGIIALEKHCLGTAFENLLDVSIVEDSLALNEHLITFERNNFAGFLIGEILDPRLEYTCGKFAATCLEHSLLVDLDGLGEVEDLEDVLVTLVTDGTKQSGHGQFFLTVDVSIHDVVNVSSELDPRTLEWDDTG